MSVAGIAKQAVKAVNFHTEAGWDPKEATVLVTTPPGWKAPPKFPRGRIIQVKKDGSRLRYLPALNVLAYLTAHGLIRMEGLEEKDAA